jgi:hypothetical protein
MRGAIWRARLMTTADGRNWSCKGFDAVRGKNLKP